MFPNVIILYDILKWAIKILILSWCDVLGYTN